MANTGLWKRATCVKNVHSFRDCRKKSLYPIAVVLSLNVSSYLKNRHFGLHIEINK